MSLIVGVGAVVWQARIASRRAAELELVAKFQADMLDQVDPTHAGQLLGADITAKFAQSLERAAVPAGERPARIAAFAEQWQTINVTDAARDLIDGAIVKPAVGVVDAKFADQPLVAASLKQTLAERYLDWGLPGAAQPLQQQALEIRRRLLGPQHPDTLASVRGMGLLQQALGKYPEAEALLREAYEQRHDVLGREHRDTLISMNELGELLPIRDKTEEAERLLRDSMEIHLRVAGADDPNTLIAINQLGMALRQQGKFAEAEKYFRQSLEGRRRVLGPDHPLTLVTLASVATDLMEQRKDDEAEPYLRERLEKQRRLRGENHPETIKALNAVSVLLADQGKAEESLQYGRDALERSRRALGPDHPDTVQYITNIGLYYYGHHRYQDAEPYMVEALQKRRVLFGPDSPEALRSTVQLAALNRLTHRPRQAIDLLAPIEAVSREKFTAGNSHHLVVLYLTLGSAKGMLGEFAPAEANLQQAVATVENYSGSTNDDRADCAAAFATLYARWEKAVPGKGYAAKAAEQTRRAHELDPTLPPIVVVEVPET